MSAWPQDLLGRAEQSSPNAALWPAVSAHLLDPVRAFIIALTHERGFTALELGDEHRGALARTGSASLMCRDHQGRGCALSAVSQRVWA